VRLNEHEVGRPHFRPTKNPAVVTSQSVNPSAFPYTGQQQTLELVRWALRDTFIALASTGIQLVQFSLFTVGIGQPFTPQGAVAATNKNKFHTNVQLQNGGLPNPQSMLVSSIRQVLRSDIYYSDMLNLLFATLATLQCGDMNRQYFEGLLAEIPGAQAGINVGFVTAGDITHGSVMSPGWQTVHNVYSLQTGLQDPNIGGPDLGVVINEGRSFSFILDPTLNSTVVANGWTTHTSAANGTGFQGWILLDGVLARSLAG
jgi:hypothetical protein